MTDVKNTDERFNGEQRETLLKFFESNLITFFVVGTLAIMLSGRDEGEEKEKKGASDVAKQSKEIAEKMLDELSEKLAKFEQEQSKEAA